MGEQRQFYSIYPLNVYKTEVNCAIFTCNTSHKAILRKQKQEKQINLVYMVIGPDDGLFYTSFTCARTGN